MQSTINREPVEKAKNVSTSYLPESTGLDGSIVETPHLLTLIPLVHEGESVQVLNNRAKSSKHADATVLHLSLTGPGYCHNTRDNKMLIRVKSTEKSLSKYAEQNL